MVRAEVSELLPGSGIDLNFFTAQPKLVSGRPNIRFLLIARMLRDKGVGENVEAAKLLRQRWPLAEF